jgi:uncharacterized protein YggE
MQHFKNTHRQMRQTLLMLIAFTLIGLAKTNAQNMGNYQYSNNQNQINRQTTTQSVNRNPASNAIISNNQEVIISVNGLMNLVADHYVAVFNIIQVAETADSANQIMNRRIQRFQQELKNIGVETSNMKIDMVSFVPKYDVQIENKIFSKTYNEVPSGFELQKNILVYYKNSNQIDQIVSAAAKHEIYDLVKVDYFVSNIQKSLDTLRTKCLQTLKSKTKSYQLIGFKLDTLNKVMSDNFITIYPQTRYISYQAYSRPSLNVAKKKVAEQVNASEITKATSSFYNQVNYDLYDLVINPIITEPVIQISYTVTVKYFVNPEPKQNNTYYILTPSGETKQLNLR